jgi:UDP-N-acetylmuramyl pentapeptide phosphotransferase/UDP-N-acetylglucosamine-1-phosphate transferase
VGVLILAGGVLLLASRLTKYLCSPASRLYFLDHPNERSLHKQPIPRTGGLAIMISLTAGFLLGQIVNQILMAGWRAALWTEPDMWQEAKAMLVLVMALLIGAISFWDDRNNLAPGVRFGIHALVAAGMVWVTNLKVDFISIPLFKSLPLGWLAIPLTVLFLMWMTNLYNFMDGMDGFAGGMTVIGFAFFAFIGWIGGNYTFAVLALLIAAAAGGFLFYNRPPARIFMGDVGSGSLGFLAGALAVMGIHDNLFDLWVPVLIFSPFIVDATTTLMKRLLRGEKVWQAHRQHHYQRLVLAGWSHRKTVLIEYVLMTLVGLSALIYRQIADSQVRLFILLTWAALYALISYGVYRVERKAQNFVQAY